MARGERTGDNAPAFSRVLYVTNAANDQFFIPGNNQESATDDGVLTIDNLTNGADASRAPGTYTVSPSTAGSGVDFNVTIEVQTAANGTAGTVDIDGITINNRGSGHAVNDTFTVTDAQLGGGGGADITFDVASLTVDDDGYPDNPDKGMMAMRLEDTQTLVGHTSVGSVDVAANQIGVAVQPGTLDTW